MGIWDWILLGLIVAGALAALMQIIRNHRAGKLTCGGDCSHCFAACSSRTQSAEK